MPDLPHLGSQALDHLLWQDPPKQLLTPSNSLNQLVQGRIISLAGAGGKTSLLFALAKILVQQGLPVITTTTTKMFKPEHVLILSNTSQNLIADLKACIQNQGWAMLGQALDNPEKSQPSTPAKLLGLSQKQLAELIIQFPQVYWLIEADGAAGKPLKFPRFDEPVLPLATDLGALSKEMVTIVVLGLSGLGQSLQEAVHRAELIASPYQTKSATSPYQTKSGVNPASFNLQIPVTPSILQQLSLALLHNSNEQSKKIIFYNQADTQITQDLPILQKQLTLNNYQTFMGSVHAQSCQAF